MRSLREADHVEFSKALDLEEQGELEAALERVKRLIASGATTSAAYAKAGGLLWELERTREAETEFRKAVERAPKWKVASLGLFHTLWDQGLRVDALEEAKRFTKLTGSDEYMEIVREINERNHSETLDEDKP